MSRQMDPGERELLKRIEAYEFDEKGVVLSFSARLARDNGWSMEFTLRVIQQYRLFAFLAVVAGPATPSDAVDQAWHLHLLRTESYWKHFCPEVLKTKLEHGPTKGGVAEHDKYLDWYSKTLDNYRAYFGEPPVDIWPSPEERMARTNFIRVDCTNNWVVPKPKCRLLPVLPRVSLVLSLIAMGAMSFFTFWITGTEKNYLFFPLFIVSCFAALWSLWELRLRRWSSSEPQMDAYSWAFLTANGCDAIDVAVAVLVDQGLLQVDEPNYKVKAVGQVPSDAHPLEAQVHSAVSSAGKSMAEVRANMSGSVSAITKQLQTDELIVNPHDDISGVVQLIGLALGAIIVSKVIIALGSKWVLIFWFWCVFIPICMAPVFLFQGQRLTSRGAALLARARQQHANLQQIPAQHSHLSSRDVVLALSLFGFSAVSQTSLKDLNKKLTPPPPPSSGDGGGGGGGCGGCGG